MGARKGNIKGGEREMRGEETTKERNLWKFNDGGGERGRACSVARVTGTVHLIN